MKKYKKLFKMSVSLTLALIMFSVFALTACKKKDDNTISLADRGIKLNTIHGGSHDYTDRYIIKGGETDYVIVIPEQSLAEEKKAAGIIQNHFIEATNLLLPIVSDSEVSYSQNLKAISIGNTMLASENSIEYEYADKSENGFQIKTKGNTVFLVGYGKGIVYSAYELLYYWFDFDYYDVFAYSLNTNVTELRLQNFDIAEIPDIETRSNHLYGALRSGIDPNAVYALRINDGNESGPMLPDGTITNATHNSLLVVPYSVYKDSHPDWFMSEIWPATGEPFQLCYSVNPDPNDENSYVGIVCEGIKAAVDSSPETMLNRVYSLGLLDNNRWCGCDRCKALENEYGVNTVGYVRVLNSIAKELACWGKEKYDYEIKIGGMAYLANEEPPVKFNETTGKYEAMDQTVVFEPNLYITYAPLYAIFMRGLDEKGNEDIYRKLQGWSALSDKLMLWGYSMSVLLYMVPYMSHNAVQRLYQTYVECNANSLLELGQWDNFNHTGWSSLLVYLQTKLMWNCQLDYNELLDRYFNGYFGIVAKEMREIFDSVNDRCLFSLEQGYLKGDAGFKPNNVPSMFPVNYVNQILLKFEQVYMALESLKVSSSKLYETLHQRVEVEEISYRYILLEFYPSIYTDSELIEKRRAFKSDAERLGFTNYGESRSLADIWEKWGVAS